MPLRDTFSAIFFVSVGLLFEPAILRDSLWPIIVITLAVVFGKVISCTLGIMATGRDAKTALRVGMGLAQIGEFSFIIASLGVMLSVTGSFLYSIAVAVSILTTLFTPYMIKYSDSAASAISFFIPKQIRSTFGLYETWMMNISPEGEESMVVLAIRRSLIQIMINLFIVSAIFFGFSYVAKTDVGGILTKISNLYVQKSLIWTGSIILSMPFLIAIYRKVKALSMLLVDLHVKEKIENKVSIRVRKIIAEMIPVISIIFMLIYIALLSLAILPPLEFLLIALLIVIIITVSLFPWLVRLHSKLQIALFSAIKK
jgi:CPA2 family monovalent cation:H+ antiporter-2